MCCGGRVRRWEKGRKVDRERGLRGGGGRNTAKGGKNVFKGIF